MWPSYLKLSLDYYHSLLKHAVPLDERAIAALAHSAVALDIYCWLAQRLHRVLPGKPQLVTWVNLQEQFGQGYTRIRKFREFFHGLLPRCRPPIQKRASRRTPTACRFSSHGRRSASA